MADKVLNFDPLKEKKRLSDLDLEIFAILNDVIQPEVSLEEGEAAKRIDELAPLGHQSEDEDSDDERIEKFLWSLWSLIIEVIQLVPRDHQGQNRITLLVKSLSQTSRCNCTIWESEASLWEDLPLLGPFMRDNWISPTYNGEVPEVQLAENWANLNSFAARLFGEGLAQWKNFAV
ncbi:hypothetical protein N7494_007927 [Penicillium frequentans]|uniref:Uncharacterized protein n=1 Tax=Penicillium frequentans TaxID=3151616 RepID=A0AAD6CTR0_9EURO|nr:hypothetical protein N7494_007927 [Penicillium glabrum]